MFVAAHPTKGAGVSVMVGVGSSEGFPASLALQAFPVFRAQTFDGGGSMDSTYADVGRIGYWSTATPSPPAGGQFAQQFLLSSIDSGRSWKPISMPGVQGAVAYSDALNWWWIGSGAQAKSSDAGGTWSFRTLRVPLPLPESVQIIDSTHIWFGAMAGSTPLVERTDDGGVSWTMFLLPAAARARQSTSAERRASLLRGSISQPREAA